MAAEMEFDLTLPEDCMRGSGASFSSRMSASDSEPTAAARGWLEKLPDLLRIVGAGVLLITMYSFLVDGWRSGNDSLRYLMMLGHTGLLALIGMASLKWLNETKGARLLLSLSLVAVPATFAILGALLFSVLAGVDPGIYPGYVAWRASSAFAAGSIAAAAVLCLAPITWLGFRVLARPMASRISWLFLANNLLLLIPVRDGNAVAGMVLIAIAVTFLLNRRVSRGQIVARTRHGLLALMLPFIPLAILMGRSLWLYSMDLFLMVSVCLCGYLFLRQLIDFTERGSWSRALLEMVSIFPAVGVLPSLTGLIQDAGWLQSAALPIAGLASASLLFDLANRSANSTLYRWLAAAVVLLSQGTNLLIDDSVLSATVTVMSGVALAITANQFRLRSMLVTAVLLIFMGLSREVVSLIIHFDLGSWVGMAILGIVAIVLASVLESKGGALVHGFRSRWQRLAEWDA